MISVAIDVPTRTAGETSLQLFDGPLSEWVIDRFLSGVSHLVKRGLRSEYQRVESTERFLRGQLDVCRQTRQHAGQRHVFPIRHDLFLPDRPENRSIRTALDAVFSGTRSPQNWRIARELRILFEDILPSGEAERDLEDWRNDRLMTHYQAVKPWCELILRRQLPLSLVGDWRGVSLLFPMEQLFERFVAQSLRRSLHTGVRLTAQASRESLCIHKGEPIFRLQPDILIEQGTDRWVLDTKWKRLDAGAESNKYGLSQADFYQLFAYGRKYLEGQGKVALIFPMTGSFSAPLSPFSFDENLTLQVLPFDLERACLVTPEDTDLPIASAHAVVQEPDPSRPQSLIDSVFQISCARAIRRLV